MGPEARDTGVQVLVLSFISCGALGKLICFSEPQFSSRTKWEMAVIVRVHGHPREVPGTQKGRIRLHLSFLPLSPFLFLTQPSCTVKSIFPTYCGGIYFRPGQRCCERAFTFSELLEIAGAKANK